MSTNTSEGSPSPVATNAPKFGTLVPNRIFVGGISASTTEAELSALFSQYGNVKATKIISDRAGVSKGYGFITFETEEEAKRIQKEADNIILKERKLNIAPAIKKQPFTRVYESCSSSLKSNQGYQGAAEASAAEGGLEEPLQMLWSSPRKCNHLVFPGQCLPSSPHLSPEADPVQTTQNGPVIYCNGVPYTYVYQNGMALFAAAPTDMYQMPQTQAAYSPIIYPHQTIYIPQPYSYHQASGLQSSGNVNSSGGVSGVTSSGPHYVYASLPPSPPVSCCATSSATCTTSTTSTMSGCLSSTPSLGEMYSYVPPGLHQYAFAAAPLHPTAYLQQQLTPMDYTEPDVNLESSSSTKSNNNNTSMGGVRPKVPLQYSSVPSSPVRGYSNGRSVRLGTSALLPTPSATQDPTRTIRHLQGQQPHLVAKQVNGVTVMAYSSPILMGPTTPSTPQQHHYEDNGVMTPPATPSTPVGTSSLVEGGYK